MITIQRKDYCRKSEYEEYPEKTNRILAKYEQENYQSFEVLNRIFFEHEALLQKKTLSEFLEDAIRTYLGMQRQHQYISDETKGVMGISSESLAKVMEDESYFES